MFDYTLTAAKILFKEQGEDGVAPAAAEKQAEEETQVPLPAT